LAELQLNSAEQKLFALLLGKHPMEQLLALDFIANESLLRGLVIFAALGLIVVSQEIAADDSEGEEIDPLTPSYVRAPPVVPAPYLPKKIQPPDNVWPDPVPKESEPGEGWTATPRRFVPGPALEALEAESSTPPPASPSEEGVFQFAAPEEEPAPAAPDDAFAAAQGAYAAWQQSPGHSGDAVPRRMYEALVAEKHELQQKLFSVLDERSSSDLVPRELFDQVQAEKRQLQEKMMLMLDELLRLRQQPEEKGGSSEKSNVRSFPGSRKKE
jgi:hypothetical protein